MTTYVKENNYKKSENEAEYHDKCALFIKMLCKPEVYHANDKYTDKPA